jgi:hypothetical protein
MPGGDPFGRSSNGVWRHYGVPAPARCDDGPTFRVLTRSSRSPLRTTGTGRLRSFPPPAQPARVAGSHPDGGLGMFGDPRCSEALNCRDVLSQIGSDGVLELAAHQRDFDLHRRGEPQPRAVFRGCQPRFRTA